MSDQIKFISTPPTSPPEPSSTKSGVRTTDSPAIHNAPLPADGPSSRHFSNLLLFSLIAGIPYLITRRIFGLGFYTWLFFTILLALPILVAYWTVLSTYTPRLNEKVKLPNRPIDYYLKFNNKQLEAKYKNSKIPLETFQELFFNGEIEFKGDALDVLELKHDWATFNFTYSLFKYFLLGMIPEVIMHSRSQDEEQVRDHYDRGDDFYSWFLGPRMIYTSGIVSDINKEETLEEIQDNKLRIVCEKIDLQKNDLLLELGCGWGTLANYASTVYGANVTGITLGKNQTKWGNDVLARSGIEESQSKILCLDYRDTPLPSTNDGKYNKITCLEMAEHVGVRHFSTFLNQVYNMLDDDGVFYLQYAGLRKCWQYEDLIWGLFMNKYIFPGADASTPLGWVIDKLEGAGFEITSVDTIGVHYSATLWRWYRNWVGNKEKVVEKYGSRWYNIWEYFLATSTITSRQGGATCFQIVMRKNLNSTHRIDYVPKQSGLLKPLELGSKWLKQN